MPPVIRKAQFLRFRIPPNTPDFLCLSVEYHDTAVSWVVMVVEKNRHAVAAALVPEFPSVRVSEF